MTKRADIASDINKLYIKGNITFDNVMMLYQRSLLMFQKYDAVICDFSQLKSTDSSGIALVVEWIKLAKKNNCVIRFENIPPALLTIAQITGVNELMQSIS